MNNTFEGIADMAISFSERLTIEKNRRNAEICNQIDTRLSEEVAKFLNLVDEIYKAELEGNNLKVKMLSEQISINRDIRDALNEERYKRS